MVLITLTVLTNCEREDIDTNQIETSEDKLVGSVKNVNELPHILDYLKTKTGGTLQTNVSVFESSNSSSSFARETSEMGDIDTNNVIQVSNEDETIKKYTFTVDDYDHTTFINLIVVETSSDIISYFIKYSPALDWLNNTNGNLSNFTGTIGLYDNDGVLKNTYTLESGDVTYATNSYDPCNEDEDPENNTSNSSGNTSSGGSNSSQDSYSDNSNGEGQYNPWSNLTDWFNNIGSGSGSYSQNYDDDEGNTENTNPDGSGSNSSGTGSGCTWPNGECYCGSNANRISLVNINNRVATDPCGAVGVSISSLAYQLDLTNDLIAFLRVFGNSYLYHSIVSFLEANNWSTESKIEAKMRIEVEYANNPDDPQWDTSHSGMINNNPALQYDARYVVPLTNGTEIMYRLINPNMPELNHKQVLLVSGNPKNINGQYNNTIPPTDFPLDGAYHYLYNYDVQEWFEFGLPFPPNDCLSCDLNDMFEYVLTNSLVITGRYFLPAEDLLILITGEDFDGVEQSRAVAGAFFIIDWIPGAKALKLVKGVKYADEVVQVGEVIIKKADEFFDAVATTQRDIVNNVLDQVDWYELDLFNNSIRKANFGEMVTDVDMYTRGYEPIHGRTTYLDDPSVVDNYKVDHVFKNPQTGEYIIIDSKFGSSSLGTLANGTPQMSHDWITSGNRIENAVGDPILAEQIANSNYTSVLAKISPINGDITYYKLNSDGQSIGLWNF